MCTNIIEELLYTFGQSTQDETEAEENKDEDKGNDDEDKGPEHGANMRILVVLIQSFISHKMTRKVVVLTSQQTATLVLTSQPNRICPVTRKTRSSIWTTSFISSMKMKLVRYFLTFKQV